MVNPNVIYKVTGRYMDGQKIVGYHLVGEDGSQAQENKDRIIWLISKGRISNMRIQVGTNKEIIIRGKGVNLNNLPVYDSVKQQFRGDQASQQAANSAVQVDNNVSEANAMGQYTIIKRIMFKNSCLGYELQDHSGAVVRKKRDDVINLAIQKLISNAVAQKYTKQGETVAKVIIRGIGCDLSKLPILIVNEDGKIVNPVQESTELAIRGAYMKRSGIIHDSINDREITFKAGDFILCEADGNISIKSRLDTENEYEIDTSGSKAICDDYLDIAGHYSVEILGSKPIKLSENIIKSWKILKPIKKTA